MRNSILITFGQLRNDRNHFESVRATACVKRGKWYYEAQLLSHGIIQIGWATSRCRFSPDEGYGVGDDCVSVFFFSLIVNLYQLTYIVFNRMALHLIHFVLQFGLMEYVFIPMEIVELDVPQEMQSVLFWILTMVHVLTTLMVRTLA